MKLLASNECTRKIGMVKGSGEIQGEGWAKCYKKKT